MIVIAFTASRTIVSGTLRHIYFTTDYRFYSRFPASIVKSYNTVHNAMIRDGDRFLTESRDCLWNTRYSAGTVKQTVLAVKMEMDKISHILRSFQHFFEKSIRRLRRWLTPDFVMGGVCFSASSESVALGNAALISSVARSSSGSSSALPDCIIVSIAFICSLDAATDLAYIGKFTV